MVADKQSRFRDKMRRKQIKSGQVVSSLKVPEAKPEATLTTQHSQDDFLKLLLMKERKADLLEKEIAELKAHRDNLQKRCDAQLEVIELLKTKKSITRTPRKPRTVRQPVELTDLPEFDASDLQQVVSAPEASTVAQSRRSLGAGSIAAVPKTLGKRVLKKIFSVLF